MNESLPIAYLVRHGETAWSRLGQHTGRTDLPLTELGEQDARRLAEELAPLSFGAVYTSPLQRAARTCELAGFGAVAQRDADLLEWDYGDYEGRTSAQIEAARPGWNLFRDGCPGGEAAADVGARADRAITRIREGSGDILVFSSAHILRVLAARWLGLPPEAGRCFVLGTASLSGLGYEHRVGKPVVRFWNETPHR